MQTLFISGTGTNVGKTYTTLKLIEAFGAKGFKVGVYKPIETGVTDQPLDAAILLDACQKVNYTFENFTPQEVTAYTFTLPAAPFCADVQQQIDFNTIIQKHEALKSQCDILLVEGAGGLMVPITKDMMMIDLAQKFEAKVLLVTSSRLGCINETLLSIEALKQRNIPFEWCVNLHEEKSSFAEVIQPFYDAVFPDWWSLEEGLQRFINRY
ncbi:MAG: hypothetical protein RL113_828 [Pseudomonadota bacterium]